MLKCTCFSGHPLLICNCISYYILHTCFYICGHLYYLCFRPLLTDIFLCFRPLLSDIFSCFQATKYKCRSGNNKCDVSLANRRSCQACRYSTSRFASLKTIRFRKLHTAFYERWCTPHSFLATCVFLISSLSMWLFVSHHTINSILLRILPC